MEVVQLLGLQGFWQHQVLRGVGGLGSRKYSALEGYGSQYWPICSSILAWRTALSDREAWQAMVYRVAESNTTKVATICLLHFNAFLMRQQGNTGFGVTHSLVHHSPTVLLI